MQEKSELNNAKAIAGQFLADQTWKGLQRMLLGYIC
jgi:hypothetical protein